MIEENTVWTKLESTALGDFVASSTWAFPTIETIHVIALVTVLGSILVMDLRLLGLTAKDYAVTKMSRDTLRLTWGAFILAVISGSLLFISEASRLVYNEYFLYKMGLIVLAGINMAVFHLMTWKNVAEWDTGTPIPTSAKLAGGLSIVFWMVIVLFGRTVGFTLGAFYQ